MGAVLWLLATWCWSVIPFSTGLSEKPKAACSATWDVRCEWLWILTIIPRCSGQQLCSELHWPQGQSSCALAASVFTKSRLLKSLRLCDGNAHGRCWDVQTKPASHGLRAAWQHSCAGQPAHPSGRDGTDQPGAPIGRGGAYSMCQTPAGVYSSHCFPAFPAPAPHWACAQRPFSAAAPPSLRPWDPVPRRGAVNSASPPRQSACGRPGMKWVAEPRATRPGHGAEEVHLGQRGGRETDEALRSSGGDGMEGGGAGEKWVGGAGPAGRGNPERRRYPLAPVRRARWRILLTKRNRRGLLGEERLGHHFALWGWCFPGGAVSDPNSFSLSRNREAEGWSRAGPVQLRHLAERVARSLREVKRWAGGWGRVTGRLGGF